MQITADFSTHTLTALTATILGVTGIFTLFILYRTYKYEIGRLFRRLFVYAPRLPTPAYFSHPASSTLTYYGHPGGAFHPHPYNHLSAPYIDPDVPDNWNTFPTLLTMLVMGTRETKCGLV
ncbi:hypothetical protein ARMSODRAFT_1024887 [Armillaria solidipes]|uniref:Uncharacterized protein n=1 Tax=Armillaria solidipes TaxID=1076256 RepID=A0A2H3B0N4_9AGAR|nr:hypothetical protein ARMSODRAFT_1024887 [Armillaria solidipes]